MSKVFAIIAVLFCISLVVLAATDPYESDVTIDNSPYQLMKVRIESANGHQVDVQGQSFRYGVEMMVNYNKRTGTVSPVKFDGIASSQNDTLIMQNIGQQPFQIIPNTNGGCFVMNPATGKTWAIDAEGFSIVALTDE